MLIHEVEADAVCLQEINDTMIKGHRQKTEKELKKALPEPMISIATCSDKPRASTYQPGGTMVAHSLPIPRRQKGQSHKAMGRWSHVALRVRGGSAATTRRLHIISLYRASDTKNGQSLAYNQQQRVLIQQKMLSSPDAALLHDLGELLEK